MEATMMAHCSKARQILSSMQPLIAKCQSTKDKTRAVHALADDFLRKDLDVARSKIEGASEAE